MTRKKKTSRQVKKCIYIIGKCRERSAKINACRVKKMEKRSKLLEQIIADTNKRLLEDKFASSTEYSNLLKEYIIQVFALCTQI